MNPEVDLYLSQAKKWREESEKLRRILLDSPLTEVLKWGKSKSPPKSGGFTRNLKIAINPDQLCAGYWARFHQWY